MTPRVSVLMSVHNGLPFLARAVESILGQSLTDLELILIDDGSTDGGGEVMAELARKDARVRLVVNQANLGLTRSLLKGLALAQGGLIARQDADDESLPTRLELQAAAFAQSPGLALLGTGIIETDAAGNPGAESLQPSLPTVIQRKMLFENAFFHPTVMWRREAFAHAGLAYDPGLPYAQDYDLFSRALWRLECANLRHALVRFRAHPGQISKGKVEGQQAVADRVAWANFQAFGLGGDFSQADVALLRRLGLRRHGLSPAERRAQWGLWQRLFARLEQGLSLEERAQWREVKRPRLGLLRRGLAGWPPLMGPLTQVVAADPADAVGDALAVARRRLGGRA